MDSEELASSPVFAGLVKPILIAGIERPLFFLLLAVAALPSAYSFNPFTFGFTIFLGIVLVTVAKMFSAGDTQTFEIILDSFEQPSSLDAHSGYNAKSARHPLFK